MTDATFEHSGLATVFGGSGFLGRHIVGALVSKGWRVRVAVRRPDLAAFLQPIGGGGPIQAVPAHLRYPASTAAAPQGASLVVHAPRGKAARGGEHHHARPGGGAVA